MTEKPHSMYENEHAEFLFAKVLAPHVSRLPLEQDRLDACRHLAALIEQLETQRRTLERIRDWRNFRHTGEVRDAAAAALSNPASRAGA